MTIGFFSRAMRRRVRQAPQAATSTQPVSEPTSEPNHGRWPSSYPAFYGTNGEILPATCARVVPAIPVAPRVPVISYVALLDETHDATLFKRLALPTLPFASEAVNYQPMPPCDVIRADGILRRVWRRFRRLFI